MTLKRMDRSKWELEPAIWLDARRALWLANERVLAVADLHLGYAWAHRHSGNLLPLSKDDALVRRLEELVSDYAPAALALVGDIVHRAVSIGAMREELCDLFRRLSKRVTLRLIAGNHDKRLSALLHECEIEAPLLDHLRIGPHLLVHGDQCNATWATREFAAAAARRGRIICGHTHPAIRISDGVATSAKCPCFAIAGPLVVLPAFTDWSAGTDVRSAHFFEALPQERQVEEAVAIVAGKLLPIKSP
jgi:putative SbcD/Mre11-related phosphoesterase